MRVAKDYSGTHVQQFVHKEETALKHLLMYQHTPLCLSADHQKNAYQVRRQPRPRRICDSQRGAIDEILNLVYLFLVDSDIITLHLEMNPNSLEYLRHKTEISVTYIL